MFYQEGEVWSLKPACVDYAPNLFLFKGGLYLTYTGIHWSNSQECPALCLAFPGKVQFILCPFSSQARPLCSCTYRFASLAAQLLSIQETLEFNFPSFLTLFFSFGEGGSLFSPSEPKCYQNDRDFHLIGVTYTHNTLKKKQSTNQKKLWGMHVFNTPLPTHTYSLNKVSSSIVYHITLS